MKSIMAGEQFATVDKDARALVAETIRVVDHARTGGDAAETYADELLDPLTH